ncbi:MAG: sigma-70 family RNA polymerase sigma factor [Candidatus Latescibacteria bacterium]|nr:sigma-70 family RNA polymerase sigma factor [Candidatus Latescibacterota bacterium]
MSQSDGRAVLAVVDGDTDRFSILVDKYHYLAEQWAFRYLGTWSQVETVVQEAFVEAYLNLSKLRRPERFAAWFKSIVTHLAATQRKRARYTVSFEWLVDAHGEISFSEQYRTERVRTPDLDYAQREEQRRLHRALAALSPGHRRIIQWFYFERFSYRQIARCLNASIPAVRSMLHRARGQLKEEMTNHG